MNLLQQNTVLKEANNAFSGLFFVCCIVQIVFCGRQTLFCFVCKGKKLQQNMS